MSLVASKEFRLWYRQPASKWLEALPLGNGRLGAMLWGGPQRERAGLNIDTLWSGGPRTAHPVGSAAVLAELRAAVLERRAYAEADALALRLQGSFNEVKGAKMWTAARNCGVRRDLRRGRKTGAARNFGAEGAPRSAAVARICRPSGDSQVVHLNQSTGPITRRPEDYAATDRYSWMSPPSTSWRLTASEGGSRGAARRAGTPRSRPRCGRSVL